MQQLMPYVDVCIANEEDAKNVFGIVSDGTDIDKAQINKMDTSMWPVSLPVNLDFAR